MMSFTTATADLHADRLWRSTYARYQGIILSTGYFTASGSGSGSGSSDWYDPSATTRGMRCTSIRRASASGWHRSPAYLGSQLLPTLWSSTAAPDRTNAPLELGLTDAGQQVFWYLQGDCRIPIYDTPETPAVGVTPLTVASVPLLVGTDGLTYGAIWTTGEGCQYLALTLGHSPRALHSLLLGYGVLNWVTCGLFLGQRKVSLNIQIDDIFTCNQLWNERTGSSEDGQSYRLADGDIDAAVPCDLTRSTPAQQRPVHPELRVQRRRRHSYPCRQGSRRHICRPPSPLRLDQSRLHTFAVG